MPQQKESNEQEAPASCAFRNKLLSPCLISKTLLWWLSGFCITSYWIKPSHFRLYPQNCNWLNTLALWQLFSLRHWLGLNWKSQEMGILTEVEAIENDLEGKGHKRKSHHQTGFPISMPLKMHCRKYNHPFSQYIRIDFRFWIETNTPFQHHLSEGVKVSPTNTKPCPKINW